MKRSGGQWRMIRSMGPLLGDESQVVAERAKLGQLSVLISHKKNRTDTVSNCHSGGLVPFSTQLGGYGC